MAYKLTMADQKRINGLVEKLSLQKETMDTAVATYNETVNEARGKVDDELAVLNEIREELCGVLEDLVSHHSDNFDSSSEKFQESDRGVATKEWIDKLEEIQNELSDEVEIDTVEDLEFDISDHALMTIEENLPSEPEY